MTMKMNHNALMAVAVAAAMALSGVALGQGGGGGSGRLGKRRWPLVISCSLFVERRAPRPSGSEVAGRGRPALHQKAKWRKLSTFR